MSSQPSGSNASPNDNSQPGGNVSNASSSSNNNSRRADASPSLVNPLIPEVYIAEKTQINIFYSMGALIQIIKYHTITKLPYSADEAWEYYRIWLLLDLLYLLLTIPFRLSCPFDPTKSKRVFLLYVCGLWTLSAAMVIGSDATKPHARRISELTMIFSLLNPFGSTARTYIHQGYNALQNSPRDGARLGRGSHCIPSENQTVFVPILVEHADLIGLKYAFTPLAHTSSDRRRVENVYLSAHELETIKTRHATLYPNRHKNSWDKTVYIEVAYPGSIRLERVLYFPRLDAHIFDPPDIIVSPCPRARFASLAPSSGDIRCQGCDGSRMPLLVDVHGVPPLTLRWTRLFNKTRSRDIISDIVPIATTPRFNTPAYRAKDFQPGNPAQPHHVRITLPMTCNEIGDHIYILDNIVDAFGNEMELHDELVSTEQVSTTETIYPLTVLPRPKVVFAGCSATQPLRIKEGTSTSLLLETSTLDTDGQNLVNVLVRYRPSRHIYDDTRHANVFPWEKAFTIPGGKSQMEIPALYSGEYSVVEVNDKFCPGEATQETTCSVLEHAVPTAEISWEPAVECYGVKGIAIDLSLTGAPPFTLQYTLSLAGYLQSTFTKEFDLPRARFFIQPSIGGNYTVAFNQISDANYQNVTLPTTEIVQTIQEPLAAKFITGVPSPASNHRVLNTCDDTAVEVSVDLSGFGPWTLGLQIRDSTGSRYKNLRHIEKSPHKFDIDVPFELRGNEGSFQVFILTVQDARGCKVNASTSALMVNVRENKPTVKFGGDRSLGLIEAKSLELPILLSGRAPWIVTYYREEFPEEVTTLNTSTARTAITVTKPGLYRLLGVESRDCLGVALSSASSIQVRAIPKPSLELDYTKGFSYDSLTGSRVLYHSCQGSPEHVSLDLQGTPPFQVALNVTEIATDGATFTYHPTFYSSGNHYSMQLQTSSAGRIIYKLLHVADSVYSISDLPLATSEEFTFEQQIFTKPTAHFKSRKPLEQYLHNPFQSLDWATSISLVGLPPFRLQLSVRHVSSGQVDSVAVEVHDHDWRINVPTYIFRSLGRHVVHIVSVLDASGCPYQPENTSPDALFVDVHPSPISAPQRSHFCVGDVASFDLDGNPPWRISFRLEGRYQTQDVTCSPWNLPLDRPGELALSSITHGDIQRPVSLALHYQVYTRPAAVVNYPNLVTNDNHFGEEVSVNITLFGTPPFTFSYQRVTAIGHDLTVKEGDKHTVVDFKNNHYMFHTMYKGKWEVVEIADRYCRSS